MYFELKNFDMLSAAMKEFCEYLKENGVSEDSIFNSKLVSSELINNIFQHSDGVAFFKSELEGERIIIKVRSNVEFIPPEKSCCSEVTAERGRGLYLVDCFSEERTRTGDGAICVVVKAQFNKK